MLHRAFTNPGAMKLSEGERARYEAAGVTEPAIQRYLAWRRALLLMVVVATVLSAGLTTYRNLTEDDEQPAFFETLQARFMAMAQKSVSADAIKGKIKDLAPPGAVDALKQKVNEVAPPGTIDALKEKANEVVPPGTIDALKEKSKDLIPPGSLKLPPVPAPDPEEKKPDSPKPEKAEKEKDDDDEKDKGKDKPETVKPDNDKSGEEAAQAEQEEEAPKSAGARAFSKFIDIMESAPLYVLAALALAAFFLGNNLRLSFKLLVAGFLFGFLLPMVIAVCPSSWFGEQEKEVLGEVVDGVKYIVMLLPTILSLVPGVLKGCQKVKVLVPQSILPGWFMVMAAPLYGLFLLVIFIGVDQFTADPLILGGLACIVLAHFAYVFRAGAFTAPLISDADRRRLKGAQLMVLGFTALGGILLLTFILTRDILGIKVFGTNPKTSVLQPIDLLDFGLEIIARSMFITALSVDLFMRMNLTNWRQHRALAASEDSGGYDKAMGNLETLTN
jgi:hypothetical protein